jgi:hypothetical protein
MKSFEVTLATSRPGEQAAFVVAARVLRIEEPADIYDRDARCVIVQDDGSRVTVRESPRETRRRFEACFVEEVVNELR